MYWPAGKESGSGRSFGSCTAASALEGGRPPARLAIAPVPDPRPRGPAVARPRTVVVTLGSHAEYLAEEDLGSPGPRVLVQPEDRGTAAAVLLAARWIAWQDFDATVAVFPSDHLVVGEAVFMTQVVDLARAVARHPQMIILLDAAPTGPDPEYGWIEPGECLDVTPAGPIFRVSRVLGEAVFSGGPSVPRARLALEYPRARGEGRSPHRPGTPGSSEP